IRHAFAPNDCPAVTVDPSARPSTTTLAPSAAPATEAPSGNASPDERGPSWRRLSCGTGGFGCSAVRTFCAENRDPNDGASSLGSLAETVHGVGNLPATNSARTNAAAIAQRASTRTPERRGGTGQGSGITVGSSDRGRR